MTIRNAQVTMALDGVAAIDCHGILREHLNRMRAVSLDETNDSMLLRLQMSLNSYFHFLSRLDPEQHVLQTRLNESRSRFATLVEVGGGIERIEHEFREAVARLIPQISSLEGPSLLSWVHQIRYYLTRAIAKLDDLTNWATSLAYLKSHREEAKKYATLLVNLKPELTSQSMSLLERLESEFAKPWSLGKGRRTKLFCTHLEAALSAQRSLIKDLVDTKAETDSVIEKLLPVTDDSVKTLIREYEDQLDAPTPRLKYLAHQLEEILRQSSVRKLISQIRNSFNERMSRVRDWTGTGDWVEALRVEHGRLTSTSEVSQRVLPTFEASARLKRDLKNAEQRDELVSRRESLSRTLVEAELKLDDQVISSSERVDWFVKRLSARRGRGKRCAQFGETILPDDETVQCIVCSAYCHSECLAEERCPVCGSESFRSR